MADSPWGSTAPSSPRPASTKSTRSVRSPSSSRTTEQTPLLARQDDRDTDTDEPASSGAAFSLLRSLGGGKRTGSGAKGSRWPSLIALLLLCAAVIAIMVLGFFAPQAVEDYAQAAVVFKPTGLKFESFNIDGVSVRVQGDFSMDASRVEKKSVRDFGRFGTWIAREVESGKSHVEVVLPAYGDSVLGTAEIPGIKVDIRNGHTTHVDFVAALRPGSLASVRDIANDWLEGRLGQLQVIGKADVPLRSGLIQLGTQTIEQALVFEGNAIPTIPAYSIGKLNIHEVLLPDTQKGLQADVSLTVANDYPVEITLPPLGFGILVDNCAPGDPIMVADATTANVPVEPYHDVDLNVTGVVRLLPDALMNACPGSKKSPLDQFLGEYIHGQDATVYVRGSDSPSADTPKWITDLISGITVPIPFPGHAPEHFLKNFSLADVHFRLPELLAEPGSPEAQPRISANIKALVGLPEEMNFPLGVDRVKADADIYYHGKKFGKLDISRRWQPANSTRIIAHGKTQAGLAVDSHVKDAPLTITDDDVFTDVVQGLLLGSETLILSVKADVDVGMETALGKFAVRNIPAEGVVPVKPIGTGGGGFRKLAPKVGNLKILDTGPSSITLSAEANFTNPTNYSATVPYLDISILVNGTVLGHATVKNVVVGPGNNTRVPIEAVWDPLTASGPEGKEIGKELLSQYISGFNTTLTLRTHNDSVPAQPALGRALSGLTVEFPTPRLGPPSKPGDGGDDGGADDGRPHFIKDATMHLITSSAIFTLASPLTSSTLYVTYINATAFYHEDAVGKILYDLPFAVPPGESTSPRLPVDWNLGSVGYEAVRQALGGALRLKARATVGIKVGRFEERLWFLGRGIGAHVRL